MEATVPASSILEPPTPIAAKKRKGIPRAAVIAIGAAVVVAAAVAVYMIATANQRTTDDAQVESDVVPLAPRVGGLVVHQRVQENQPVKAGQIILELDPADYAARVQAAEAELATATAQAEAADAQEHVIEASAKGGFSSARAAVSGSSVAVANADAQIASAKAALLRAEADSRKAQLDFDRAKQLLAANAIPQERFDNAQAALQVSQAALAGARAQLNATEEGKRAAESRVAEARGRFEASSPIDAQIASARANASLAHARVKGAEAQLALAKLQLSYTQVTAPADGEISKLNAHEGQLLAPGQAVAELVPSTTYLIANFKETQLENMKPGQTAKIEVDAFPGEKLEGKVESISGGTGARFSLLPPDNSSGNFVKVVQRVPVRIAWTHVPKGVDLRAGLSAEVTVYTKR